MPMVIGAADTVIHHVALLEVGPHMQAKGAENVGPAIGAPEHNHFAVQERTSDYFTLPGFR